MAKAFTVCVKHYVTETERKLFHLLPLLISQLCGRYLIELKRWGSLSETELCDFYVLLSTVFVKKRLRFRLVWERVFSSMKWKLFNSLPLLTSHLCGRSLIKLKRWRSLSDNELCDVYELLSTVFVKKKKKKKKKTFAVQDLCGRVYFPTRSSIGMCSLNRYTFLLWD